MMKNDCLACNGATSPVKYVNRDFSFLSARGKNIFERLEIRTCPNCGFGFAAPFIGQDALSSFYRDDYSSEGGPHYTYREIKYYLWKNRVNTRFFAQFLLAGQYLDLSKVGAFLDVGAGIGESFVTFRKMGYNASCYALEAGDALQKEMTGQGVTVLRARDKYLGLEDEYRNKFDLIVSSHTLEHFNGDQLAGILRNLHSYLKPGGVLICEVPNDDCRLVDLSQENTAPHLSFFSADALSALFKSAGFKIHYLNTVGELRRNAGLPLDVAGSKLRTSGIRAALRSLTKRIGLLDEARQMAGYLLLYLKARYRHRVHNHLLDLVATPDLHYGAERANIRICAYK